MLLRETRVAHAVSQKTLSAIAGYSIRNLISVENGKQNPLVSTALNLASATGCDLEWFFDELAKRYYELQKGPTDSPERSGG
ncbi:MAG: helix-turn-helix transcriptional regulator [Desulfovibrionaceae bacterium]|nr:helix-turn-helix transcriptional regulator [Desulfovibrionaceae bacterium]